MLLGAWLAALPPLTAVSAGDAGATRAEIERWFGTLRSAHDMAAPQRWEYSFVAADGRALEALSLALVRDGYEIRSLDAKAGPALRVTKTELHSPLTLAQRNQALQQTARQHHARYVGVDVAN
jgi:hypothetical protein